MNIDEKTVEVPNKWAAFTGNGQTLNGKSPLSDSKRFGKNDKNDGYFNITWLA
jgi:hypothetical protein